MRGESVSTLPRSSEVVPLIKNAKLMWFSKCYFPQK